MSRVVSVKRLHVPNPRSICFTLAEDGTLVIGKRYVVRNMLILSRTSDRKQLLRARRLPDPSDEARDQAKFIEERARRGLTGSASRVTWEFTHASGAKNFLDNGDAPNIRIRVCWSGNWDYNWGDGRTSHGPADRRLAVVCF